MRYRGSCHCGKIRFEVEGTIEQAIDCNCSHCSRKGYLLWFVERDRLQLTAGADELATYEFYKHVIKHHFCPQCGCAPFGFGTAPGGIAKAAVNVRCIEDFDVKTIKLVPVDGKSF